MMTLEFWAINLALSLSLAIDAVMVTFAGYSYFKNWRASWRWSIAVGGTHLLFPLIGFVGGFYIADSRISRIAVYSLGGLVLTVFTGLVLRDALRPLSAAPALQKRFALAVIAVSIDALITGPGKTAVTARWNAAQVWFSFFLVGLLVFVLVLIATIPARRLNERVSQLEQGTTVDHLKNARAFTAGILLEVIVFSYFVLRSGKEVLLLCDIETSRTTMAVVTLSVAGILLLTCWQRVFRAQSSNVRASLGPGSERENMASDA